MGRVGDQQLATCQEPFAIGGKDFPILKLCLLGHQLHPLIGMTGFGESLLLNVELFRQRLGRIHGRNHRGNRRAGIAG